MPSAPSEKTLFGHPVGLSYLFLTGMWEVVALFGMKTILVLYLVNQLHYSATSAVKIFGLSTALSFLMSVFGGVAADRFVGLRRAVIAGALTLAGAHFLLIVPFLLFPSLFLIALGSGLFRPSLVAQVYLLYSDEDARRSRALVLYKLGCNIGGIIGPIACGALYEYVGWSVAVGFSGVGMLIALAIYVGGRRYLSSGIASRTTDLIQHRDLGTPSISHQLFIVSALGFGAALHWTAANQQGGTMALWAYQSLNRTVHFGSYALTIPAAWFQSLNPIFIILFSPLVTFLWSRPGTGVGPYVELRRMALGSVMLAVAFCVLALAAAIHDGGKVSWVWLVLAMMPITLGELYIDPMGQEIFSRLAPSRFLSTFISLWFVTQTVGYLGAGWLSDVWVRTSTKWFFLLSSGIALLSALSLRSCKRLIEYRT